MISEIPICFFCFRSDPEWKTKWSAYSLSDKFFEEWREKYPQFLQIRGKGFAMCDQCCHRSKTEARFILEAILDYLKKEWDKASN